jgi:hypothetical protein
VIRYDRSSWSVVAYCTCGWRELCLTQDGAWRAARGHETGQHPDRFQVRHAEDERRRHRNENRPQPNAADGTRNLRGPGAR